MGGKSCFTTLWAVLLIAIAAPSLYWHLSRSALLEYLCTNAALWVTLKHLLQRKQSKYSPTRVLAALATMQSADIVLPTTDARQIRLRRITEPTEEQKRLLLELDMDMPHQLQINQQCSADFAIA